MALLSLLANGNRLNQPIPSIAYGPSPLNSRLQYEYLTHYRSFSVQFFCHLYSYHRRTKRNELSSALATVLIHIMHPNSHVTNILFANTQITQKNAFAIMRIDLFALRWERVRQKIKQESNRVKRWSIVCNPSL